MRSKAYNIIIISDNNKNKVLISFEQKRLLKPKLRFVVLYLLLNFSNSFFEISTL